MPLTIHKDSYSLIIETLSKSISMSLIVIIKPRYFIYLILNLYFLIFT